MSSVARPQVSVVMPVRNAMPYLDEAVASILGQSFGDFELVIGDDGSTDGSSERLAQWAQRDSRIRLIGRRNGVGPVGSSNWVAGAARAELVARMDADDVAHPDRLRLQVEALAAAPDASLAGTLWDAVDSTGQLVRGRDRSTLLRTVPPPILHGTMMYRRRCFEAVGGYRTGSDFWEDWDLQRRLSGAGSVLMLPEALYRYRFSASSGRLHGHAAQVEDALELAARYDALLTSGADDEAEALVLTRGAEPWDRVGLDCFLLAYGYVRVWSGTRARMFGRMVRRGRLRTDRATLRALLWAFAAEASPRLLRRVMKARVERRDQLAAAAVPDGRFYSWTRAAPAPAEAKPRVALRARRPK